MNESDSREAKVTRGCVRKRYREKGTVEGVKAGGREAWTGRRRTRASMEEVRKRCTW